MKPAIFAGPTLFNDPVLADRNFAWLPPAVQGDLYRVARRRPLAIGLIDACFEAQPTVWHKEILWALSQGIHVFGAASMGALRAAELARFGMRGVGAIFRAYSDGGLSDDDEVAVLHAPKELAFQPLSEALVDIRATLVAAKLARIVSARGARVILAHAKKSFFKERSWPELLKKAAREGLQGDELSRLARWLPVNRVDQKRLDALEMIEAMRTFLAGSPAPFCAAFAFERTAHWHQLVERRHR